MAIERTIGRKVKRLINQQKKHSNNNQMVNNLQGRINGLKGLEAKGKRR